MEFRILGPLEVGDDGRPVPLGGGRERALLAVLLLHRNRAVPAERLIEELWGGRAPRTAANLVQVYVSRLRKALGRERLVTSGSGYELRVDDGEVDLDRFERLVAGGSRRLALGEPERASAELAEALALWRGPPLADFTFEAFAQNEIGRLEELRLAALEERVQADLAAGRHAVVVGELEALVAEHPFRERLRGQLMLALYRSGRQADALELYRETRRTFVDELGIEPTPPLQELERAILAQDPALAAPAPAEAAKEEPRSNLPVPPTPLVGRGRELEEVVSLVRGGCRLVTLTGTGGTGKTRLALEAASELAAEFPDGAWWVPLARVRNPAHVLPAIVQALGVDEPLERQLAGRRALLLLDNFEHVLEAATGVASVLEAAPDLAVLVTSREPLHLSGEREYPVSPLTEDEAVELFGERARAVRPDFAADGAVAEICERLDNLPLAIELAAARVRMLSPELLLRQLQRRFDVVSGGPRDAPERHRSLHATLDWSYELLSDREKSVFRRLSVFVGGFTIDAAQGVCGGEGEADAFEVLTSLVEKSLVRRTDDQAGEPRFTLLETIREYAGERLVERDEAERARERHARWYAALAEELYEESVRDLGIRIRESLEARFLSERGNLHAALRWLANSGETEAVARLAGNLWMWAPGLVGEGRRLLRSLLEEPDAVPASVRLRALVTAAKLASDQDHEEGLRLAREAVALARCEGDDVAQLVALHALHICASELDADHAGEIADEGERLARRTGRWALVATFIINRSCAEAGRGEYARAKRGLTEALAIALEHGASDGMRAVITLNLAQVALEEGRLPEAVDKSASALALIDSDVASYDYIRADCLQSFASIAGAAGDARTAARLSAAAQAWRDREGRASMQWDKLIEERTNETVRAALRPDERVAARADGARLGLRAAVVEALTWIDAWKRAGRRPRAEPTKGAA